MVHQYQSPSMLERVVSLTTPIIRRPVQKGPRLSQNGLLARVRPWSHPRYHLHCRPGIPQRDRPGRIVIFDQGVRMTDRQAAARCVSD